MNTSRLPASHPVMTFASIESGNSWHGSDWTVTDEDALAELIAKIALGQYRHVLRILEGTSAPLSIPTNSIKAGAIRLLTAHSSQQTFHRDGWVFQAISWIAAHLQDTNTIKSAPHMIPAAKGFDGLHLRLDHRAEKVESVTVCEDKATTRPRSVIRDEVWPDFCRLDSGTRDNEIVAQASTLLASTPSIDPDQAVQKMLWESVRSYRISITIGDGENSDSGRRMLFIGYEQAVKGAGVQRRRAETLYQNNVRSWIQRIADKAIAVVEST